MNALIEFQQVCKYYYMGDTTVTAADHISFQVSKGEFVAIVGSSGSGKSTCMNIIGCLDVTSEGTYLLNGQDVGQMNKNQLAEIRNELLGFIFQQYNLLPKLNLVENVEVPLMYAGVSKAERRQRAREALALVGMDESFYEQSPFELSGGQKRRVAIAGVLAMHPEVLILDEPTAGLDPRGRDEILGQIEKLHRERGMTIILVSHSMEDVARYADRLIVMNHGEKIFDDTPRNVFRHYRELEAIGLAAPQVTYIVQALRREGIPIDDSLITVEEARDAILRLVGRAPVRDGK